MYPFQVPQWLLITFSATTVLLIAVHMLALMISTCVGFFYFLEFCIIIQYAIVYLKIKFLISDLA